VTTSYETQTTASASGLPRYNAEGHQVWNPSVGVYHKPAENQAESYGGIIGALQDLHVAETGVTKAYPHNFAGIIAAIKDLQIAAEGLPPVLPGPNPGGGQIIIDINGNPSWEIIEPPRDGELWFDTRQGRLFVAIDEEWYQTNGADGIPIVTDNANPPEVEHPIPGQFWWDAQNNDLYIHDGMWRLPDNNFTDQYEPGAAPVWKLITDGLADAFQTTYTLPLGAVGPRATSADFNYIPVPDITTFQVQSDYNVWVFEALSEVDKVLLEKGNVVIGELPPPMPAPGQMWYDTTALELSIWYEDDDSGQWVPTSVAHTYDADLDVIRASISTESRIRDKAIHDLLELIEAGNQIDQSEITELQELLATVQTRIDNLPTYDLSPFARMTTVLEHIADVQSDIHGLANSLDNLPGYALKTDVESIENQLSTFATTDEVAEVAQSIPDVSSYVTAEDITTAISNITTEYLPRTGGVLTGSFTLNKQDFDLAGLDFSTAITDSKNAFKFKTVSPTNNDYVTFGVNDNFWEYAWQFASEENFCWVYNNSDTVFSITKEGPACSTLYLGDIGDTTNTGRVIHNKIDVKERLNTYQTAFEQVRQGVANATDFDSLRANILSALASV